MRCLLALSSLLALAALTACQPTIGDSCGGSRDCSATGERQCDLAQPGGYCTVVACNPDTCPDGAICVEWRFNPSRTSETWCMRGCGGDGDCRSGYLCALPSRITMAGEREPESCPPLEDDQQLARSIDLDPGRSLAMICAAVTNATGCENEPGTEESDTDLP